MTDSHQEGRSRHQLVGLLLGPLVAGAMLLLAPPQGLSEPGWTMASVGIPMAIWWATEAVPIAVTALLPIVLFPLLGVAYGATIGGMATLVGTAPNAIVFGSGMLTIPKMVRAGMMLNLVGVFLVSLVALYLAPKSL